MSVYNGADFLKGAIESVLNQTYSAFEFIIIDDGSTDKTWEILKSYASFDNRIKLLKNNTNMGLTRSLNKGLTRAQGKYVARQDHDDLSEPMRLEKQIKFLEMHRSIVLVSCNYDIIDSNCELIKRIKLSDNDTLVEWNLIFYNYLGGHSQVMYRRDVVLSIGGYTESFSYAQDYDLWLRVSKLGRIHILPETLMKYRIHDGRLTSVAGDNQFKFVLIASANRISELTGRRPELFEANSIWSFWCLVYESDPFHAGFPAMVSTHLFIRRIFKAFTSQQRIKQSVSFKPDVKAIRFNIAKRYLNWCRYEFLKRRDILAGSIMFIAYIYWVRFDLLKIWFKGVCSLLITKKKLFKNRSQTA